MGGKCSPSGGINPEYGRSLNLNGDPNSRSDLYDEHDELIQSRWYDQDGIAMWDRHYKHQDSRHTHEFPHDHQWKWQRKKGKWVFEPREPLPVDDYNFC
jgi:hypothetical protein